MPISRSNAITAVRQRIGDEETSYQYTDTLLIAHLTAALREMETEIGEVAPEWFLTKQVRRGYTDALDADGEYYALPPDMRRLAWIERADGSWHPKVYQYTPSEAEIGRYIGSMVHPGTVAAGGETFAVPLAGAVESVSIFGDRFRVLPGITATGPEWAIFYERNIGIPSGSDVLLDLPVHFEECAILSTGIRALTRDDDPLAAALKSQLYGDRQTEGDLARAKRNVKNRNGRRRVLKPAW